MGKRVAIIGAGPSGLTSARQAISYGFKPTVFEKNADLGGIWRYSDDPNERSVMYGTVMNYSKELTAFSEMHPPEDFPNFMHHSQVLEYLRLYAEQFALLPCITFNTEVVGIHRAEDWKTSGKWKIDAVDILTSITSSYEFDAVLICTGRCSKPYRPFEWRWERRFQGKIIHAQSYKSAEKYHDKVVVVVGFGNSAVDCACDLANTAKQVYLSTRRGSWLFPRLSKHGGMPWDISYNSRLKY